MEPEEEERSAAQRVYDKAQFDYSAQVLGDRALGLPEEPTIGSIGPLPTQRFAQQFLTAAGVKLLNMTGPCNQESLTVSAIASQPFWNRCVHTQYQELKWPTGEDWQGLVFKTSYSCIWSVAFANTTTPSPGAPSRSSSRVSKNAAVDGSGPFGPFTTHQWYEPRIKDPGSDDDPARCFLAMAYSLRIYILLAKDGECPDGPKTAYSQDRIAEVRVDAIFVNPDIPALTQVCVHGMFHGMFR